MNIINFIEWVNPTVWWIANLVVVYVGVMLAVFVIAYPSFFNHRLTTGGRMIFRFSLSLFFVVVLVVIGIYLNPSHDQSWLEYPEDILWWRPVLRLVAYGYVAYTITALVIFLWNRKFHPEKLTTAPDKLLVKPRHDTAEVPTIKEKHND